MVEKTSYWEFLDHLVATSHLIIDRPKGSSHPRYPGLIYPLDYGYLEGTKSADGGGIDVWLGSANDHHLTGVILTVDALKLDAEVKLLLGCSPEEIQIALACSNNGYMRGILVLREQPGS